MNDLISRQDAIDVVNNERCEHGMIKDILCDKILISAIDKIRRLPSAQQWIPCSERLPKEKDMVLVTRRSGDVDYVSWSDWWYKQDRYPYLKPIAWMPLPDPWKGENREKDEI